MSKKLTKVVRTILVTIVATVLGFTTIIANSFMPNVVNAEGEPVSINSELVLNDDPYEATVSIKAEAQEGYSIKSITFNGETKEGQENSFSVTANGEYKVIVAYVEGTQEATSEISPEVTPENTVEETPAEQDTIDEDFGVDVQSSDEVNEQAPEVSEDPVSPEDNIEEVPESATGFFTVVNAEETILTEETTIEVNGIEEEGTFISEEAPSTEFEAQVINEESEETAVLVVKNEEKSTEYGFDVYNYYDQAIDDGLFAWGYTVGQKEQYTGWYILNPITQEWVFNNYSFISEIEIPAAPTADEATWSVVTTTPNNPLVAWNASGTPTTVDTTTTEVSTTMIEISFPGTTAGKVKKLTITIPDGTQMTKASLAPANAIADGIQPEEDAKVTANTKNCVQSVTWTPNEFAPSSTSIVLDSTGLPITNHNLGSGTLEYTFSEIASGNPETIILYVTTAVDPTITGSGLTYQVNNVGDTTKVLDSLNEYTFKARVESGDSAAEEKMFKQAFKGTQALGMGNYAERRGQLFFTDVMYNLTDSGSTSDNATGGRIQFHDYVTRMGSYYSSGLAQQIATSGRIVNYTYYDEYVYRINMPSGIIINSTASAFGPVPFTLDTSNYNIATGGYIDFIITDFIAAQLSHNTFTPDLDITFDSNYYDASAPDLGSTVMPTTTSKGSVAYFNVQAWTKIHGDNGYQYTAVASPIVNFKANTDPNFSVTGDKIVNLNENHDYKGQQSLGTVNYDTRGFAIDSSYPYKLEFGSGLKVTRINTVGKFTGTYYTDDYPLGISVTDVSEITIDPSTGHYITSIDGTVLVNKGENNTPTRISDKGRIIGRVDNALGDCSITLNNTITDSVTFGSNYNTYYPGATVSKNEVYPGDTVTVYENLTTGYYDNMQDTMTTFADPSVFIVVPKHFTLSNVIIRYDNVYNTTETPGLNLVDAATVTSYQRADGLWVYKYTFAPGTVYMMSSGAAINGYYMPGPFRIYYDLTLDQNSTYTNEAIDTADIGYVDLGHGVKGNKTVTTELGTQGTNPNNSYMAISKIFYAKQNPEVQVSAAIKGEADSSYFNYDSTNPDGTTALVAPGKVANVDIYFNNRSNNNFDKFIVYMDVPQNGNTNNNFNNANQDDPYDGTPDLKQEEWTAVLEDSIIYKGGDGITSTPGAFTAYYGTGCTVNNKTPGQLNTDVENPVNCTTWSTTYNASATFVKFEYAGTLAPSASGHIYLNLNVDSSAESAKTNYFRVMFQQEMTGDSVVSNKVGGLMAAKTATGEFAGFIFVDANANGIYDTGDTLYNPSDASELTLSITDTNNAALTWSIAYGDYDDWKKEFIDDKDYIIKATNLTVASGYTGTTIYHFSKANQGNDDQKDSDLVPVTGSGSASLTMSPVQATGDANKYIGLGLVANIPATFTVDSYGTGKGLTLSSTTGNAWPSEALASSAVPTLSPTTSNYTIAKWNIYLNGSTTPVSNENNPTTYVIPAGTTAVKYEAVVEPATFTIAYHMGTGETNPTTNPTTYSYGTAIASTSFADATKTGYTFNGWYTDSNLTASFTGITATTSGRIDLYPKFTINSHSITYSSTIPSGCTATVPSQETNVMYDASKTVSAALSCTGYTFNGWTTTNATVTSGAFNMPDNDVTFTGTWAPKTDTAYTVEHYKQNLDGTYPTTASATEAKTGTTAGTADATPKTYTGYTNNASLTTYEDSVNTTPQAGALTITADGSLVVKLYYARNTHNITYSSTIPSGCSATVPSQETNVIYDASKTVSAALSCTGYTFNGWTTTNATVTSGAFNMPDNDVTFTGTWSSIATPTPGRTCQDDGYPAGWYWNGSSCVAPGGTVTSTPSSIPTSTPIVTTRPSSSPSTSANPSSSPAINSSSTPSANPSAQTTSGPNSSSSPTITIVATITPDPSSSPITPVIGGTVIVDGKEYTIVGQNEDGLWIMEDAVGNNYILDHPEYGAENNHWALINLIAAIATLLLAIIHLVKKSTKDEDQEDEEGNPILDENGEVKTTVYKRNKLFKVVTCVMGVAAVIAFILTENLRTPMVLTDKWSLLMIVLMIVGVLSFILGNRWKENDDEDQKVQD